MALHSHFVNDVTPLDAENLNSLFRGEGQTNAGSLLIANNFYYRAVDSGGFDRNVVGIDGTDILVVGYPNASMRIDAGQLAGFPPLANDAAIRGLNVALVAQDLVKLNASDQIILGNAGFPMTLAGSQIDAVPPLINNVGVRSVDTGSTTHDLLLLNGTDELILGSAPLPLTVNGTQVDAFPPLVNNVGLQSFDVGATARNLIVLNASDEVHIGYTGQPVIFDGEVQLTQQVSLPNNTAVIGTDTLAVDHDILKLDSLDVVQLGYAGGEVSINGTVVNPLVLDNLRFLQGLDVGQVANNLIGIDGTDQIVVGEVANNLALVGDINNTLVINNTLGISVKDNGGTARNLLRMTAANEMEFGEAGFVFSFLGTFDMAPADRLVDNNVFYQGRNVATTPINLLGVNNLDITLVGDPTLGMSIRGTELTNGLPPMPNNTFYQARQPGGTAIDMVGINTGNIMFLGDSTLGTAVSMQIYPQIVNEINMQGNASIVFAGKTFLEKTVVGSTDVFLLGDAAQDNRYQFNNDVGIALNQRIIISSGANTPSIAEHGQGATSLRHFIKFGESQTVMVDRFLDGGFWFMNPGPDAVSPNNNRVNNNMTDGLTIRVGDIGSAPTGEYFNIRDGSAGLHILAGIDNNTFFRMTNITAGDRGALLHGIGTANAFGVELRGTGTVVNGITGGTATAPVQINCSVRNGTVQDTISGANNIMVIRNADTTRYIFRANGDAAADINWTVFDDWDDVGLLHALQINIQPENGLAEAITNKFGAFAERHREVLEQAGIVTFHKDRPGGFVSITRLPMLLTGAILQSAEEIRLLKQRLDALEAQYGTA